MTAEQRLTRRFLSGMRRGGGTLIEFVIRCGYYYYHFLLLGEGLVDERLCRMDVEGRKRKEKK